MIVVRQNNGKKKTLYFKAIKTNIMNGFKNEPVISVFTHLTYTKFGMNHIMVVLLFVKDIYISRHLIVFVAVHALLLCLSPFMLASIFLHVLFDLCITLLSRALLLPVH